MVKILIEYGAEVNSNAEDESTPLHKAAYQGNRKYIAMKFQISDQKSFIFSF